MNESLLAANPDCSVASFPFATGKDVIDATKKARLRWQCRRGMLELDLMLQHFVESQCDYMTEAELQVFESVLSTPDPLLFEWLMGRSNPEDKELAPLVTLIRQHKAYKL